MSQVAGIVFVIVFVIVCVIVFVFLLVCVIAFGQVMPPYHSGQMSHWSQVSGVAL